MSLMNTRAELAKATAAKYCICAFNVDNFELARAAVEAGEAERSPVIIEVLESSLDDMGLTAFAEFALRLAREASVPVGVHLDHGDNVTIAKRFIEAGFSSVMIDYSSQAVEQNIRATRQVLKWAEPAGCLVEGEIGYVPDFTDEGASDQPVYTDVDQAVRYCRESGVHALAVSIGTVHYMRNKPLILDFKLLEKIRHQVDLPLVLHGGAAVEEHDMKRAVEGGIVKYNIAFKPYRAFIQGLRRAIAEMSEEVAPGKLFVFPSRILAGGRRAAVEEMRQKIRLLGGSNQAS